MTDKVIEYAKQFIGTPYLWGGNNCINGYDCSGFVCEILKAFGVIHYKSDYNSGELLRFLAKSIPTKPEKIEQGMVLFFGKADGFVNHVAIALNDKLMIEAGGGDSRVISKELAAQFNAFVRIRPIRTDLITAILPNYVC
jgi:cell wall-associated NlpC family hydrolase